MPRTSCGPRSPASARTSRSSSDPVAAYRSRNGPRSSPRWSPRPRRCRSSSPTCSKSPGTRRRAARRSGSDSTTRCLAAVEQARQMHPTVTVTLEANQSTVVGTAPRVRRAVLNLVDNAAKWSPPGQCVDVTVHGPTVTVRDHGPGIPSGRRSTGCSTGSIDQPQPAVARARGSGCRSCGRWPRTMAAPSRRRTPIVGLCSRCGSLAWDHHWRAASGFLHLPLRFVSWSLRTLRVLDPRPRATSTEETDT